MGTTLLSVTLPDDMAQMVEDKVTSGEYATASDVIKDGLRSLQARSEEDRWLVAEVVPAYENYLRDPSSAIPANEVFDGLAARYEARKKARSAK